MAVCGRLRVGPGMRGREVWCGERGEWGTVIFRGVSPNIPENVIFSGGGVRDIYLGLVFI